MRVLLLGGTTEASALARLLAQAGVDATFSYAGRTANPVAQPLPTRSGGFGGAEGLAAHLAAEGITHVVDATHPFAAQISANAVAACTATGTTLAALERPGWREQTDDRWTRVPDADAAAAALPREATAVFLAIGRQSLAPFADLPHRWLLRFAEFDRSHPVPLNAALVVERGPYTLDGDLALLRSHGIGIVVAKDAGGTAARAKLDAARVLRLPVILIDRPALPPRLVLETPEAVMAWLHHATDRGV